MDYPYLVNALDNNLKTIAKLKEETEGILKHIGNKAVISAGRFKQQPDPKYIVPLTTKSKEYEIVKSLKNNKNSEKKGGKRSRKVKKSV